MKTDNILGEQIDEPPCHVITAHLTGAHFQQLRVHGQWPSKVCPSSPAQLKSINLTCFASVIMTFSGWRSPNT